MRGRRTSAAPLNPMPQPHHHHQQLVVSSRRISARYDTYFRSLSDVLPAVYSVSTSSDLVPDTDRDAVCLLSSITTPGEAVMLQLRRWTLEYAAQCGWVLTGGWAQHFASSSSSSSTSRTDPNHEPVYDTTSACGMGDVDAYSTDPLADLLRAAATVYQRFDMQATVNCAMKPDAYRLSVTTGHGQVTLVDMTGLSERMLSLLRVREATLQFSPSSPTLWLRYTDPVHELSRMFMVVDNVYELHVSNLSRRLERCARIEEEVRRQRVPSLSSSREYPASVLSEDVEGATLRPTASQLALDGALAALLGVRPDLSTAFAVLTVPGHAAADVLVNGRHGVDFIDALIQSLGHGDCVLRVFAPLMVIVPAVLIAEIAFPLYSPDDGPDSTTEGTITVIVNATPIPMAPGSMHNASPRFALAHLYASALWRSALGDVQGHNARLSAFFAGLAELGPRRGLPARHAGVPADSEHIRFVRWRASPFASCRITYQTPSSSSSSSPAERGEGGGGGKTSRAHDPDAFLQSMRQRGVPGAFSSYDLLQGQLLETLSYSDVQERDALARALARVVPRNFMTDVLGLPWSPRPPRVIQQQQQQQRIDASRRRGKGGRMRRR